MIDSLVVYDYNKTMPKIYKRHCDKCGVYYESQNDRFCSAKCYHESRTGVKRPDVSDRFRGSGNPRWNNGTTKLQNGYILISQPEHPYAHKNRGYVLEHRLVMEKHLGRTLEPGETVHHINHIRDDNRIENLELLSSHGEHIRLYHNHISNYHPKKIFTSCKDCGKSNVKNDSIDYCHNCYQKRWRIGKLS